ncbi:MAG: baseplate J/gp47 family protein [Proteobacteria bacterium]|nr:baseplate J/gp47 family protein [Pseudomonadota bacterium]
MIFSIRSLDEISKTVRGAFRQYLPGTDASLKGNVLYVIAKVMTLLAREYELRLDWIFRQLFLTTATGEAMVRMHAAEYGLRLKPGAGAAGTVLGIGAASAVYPAGVRFVSAGISYVTTASFQADALGRYAASVAAETIGTVTNREADAVLLLADATLYPTLGQEASVGPDGLGGGADIETVEALRARALLRKRTPPQGGALPDYERWALEVPGVVKAWAEQFATGFGTIGVWVLFAGRPHGIPTEADLAAVQAYVDELRLVRATFVAAAPVPVPVDLSIRLAPDTAAQRAAVTAVMQNFFDATGRDTRLKPGLPDSPFTLPLAWISEAISTTTGEESHRLVEPAGDPVLQPGELPVLGTITWL